MQEQTGDTRAQESPKNVRGTIAFFSVAAVLWLACLAWYVFQPSRATVESAYSRGFYRQVAALVTPLTEAVPFSLSFTMLIGVPVLFLILWAANWAYRRRVRKQPHWRGLIWGPKWILLLVPFFWLWFLVFWGMGYARQPVETRLNFDKENVSEEELVRIKDGLLEVILRDQPAGPEDRQADRALAAVSKAMQDVVMEWENVAVRLPRRVKATPAGFLMMNGTSGVCAPFTLEPHVDGGLPDTWFVAVGAHELGHIAGVCDEGETNLIGYVAGLRADDRFARYAVALEVYLSVARQFGNEARKAALERLPEQAHEDIRRAREAHERYRIDWLQKWSWRAYNQYLKSQGVQEGVRSYGRGTQLLAKAWRAGYLKLPETAASPEIPANQPVMENAPAGT